MINLILFGPPGSGKGTQADKLVEKYGLTHISTGDLFRDELENDTELGQLAKSYMNKGELVPDHVTVRMLKKKMDAHPGARGVIFDGFPRTIEQAESLDDLLHEMGEEIDGLLLLSVPDEEIIERILKRGETSGRADDNDPEIINNRIQVYRQNTEPVFQYYAKRGVAHSVDGLGDIEEIFERLSAHVDVLLVDLRM